jgi:hypothetical protein
MTDLAEVVAGALEPRSIVEAAAVPAEPDPLFRDDIEARFRKLRRQIALEAQSA